MFGQNTKKAEKLFVDVVGSTVANSLLQQATKEEDLDANKILKIVKDNAKDVYDAFGEKKLGALFDKNGIVDLLSSSFWTSRNSNFVKLVKNNAVGTDLKKFLTADPNTPNSKSLKPQLGTWRRNIEKYIKMTKQSGSEGRNKNEDVSQKMQSSRLIDRLKVMVAAYIIALIDLKIESLVEPLGAYIELVSGKDEPLCLMLEITDPNDVPLKGEKYRDYRSKYWEKFSEYNGTILGAATNPTRKTFAQKRNSIGNIFFSVLGNTELKKAVEELKKHAESVAKELGRAVNITVSSWNMGFD